MNNEFGFMNIKKLKKARRLLDDAVLGYTEGNIAEELDEAYKIIDEVITEVEKQWTKNNL